MIKKMVRAALFVIILAISLLEVGIGYIVCVIRGRIKMKRVLGVFLASLTILSFLSFAIPKPANAGSKDLLIGGALLGGGFLLGSIFGPHDRIIIGPVYPAYPYSYPPPVYYYPPPIYYPPPTTYSPPVYYPPTARWIPDHYELRWQTVCEIMYQRQNCYQTQITVFIPGHWEY